MTRSLLDIQTDEHGHSTQHLREICGGCGKPRIIRVWQLEGRPNHWCPDDLIGLCRRCESKQRNNIEAAKLKPKPPYRWL